MSIGQMQGLTSLTSEGRAIPVSVEVTEVVGEVVVDILGLLVGVEELLGDIGEVIVVGQIVVVWTELVVNVLTGSPVGLPVGQSVVGSNVGHDVAIVVASGEDSVVHGGQEE